MNVPSLFMDQLPLDRVTGKLMDEGLGATMSDGACSAKLLMGLLPPHDIGGVIDEIVWYIFVVVCCFW